MKIAGVALFLLVALASANLQGAGFSHDKNFIVYAPDQELADQILASAVDFRTQISEAWLGRALPEGLGRTIISIEVSSTDDRAFTLPVSGPDRKFHNIWLTTTREKAVGSTLRHEIAHAILNTQFPERLPTAIEEGIASLHDDAQRFEKRRQLMQRFYERGDWPRLQPILEARNINSRDQSAYTVSTSFVEYLLTRGDKPALLRFAVGGKSAGWDRAAQDYYQARSLAELEMGWRAWVSKNSDKPAYSVEALARQPLSSARLQ